MLLGNTKLMRLLGSPDGCEERKWENQAERRSFQQSFKALPFKAELWPHTGAFSENLFLRKHYGNFRC